MTINVRIECSSIAWEIDSGRGWPTHVDQVVPSRELLANYQGQSFAQHESALFELAALAMAKTTMWPAKLAGDHPLHRFYTAFAPLVLSFRFFKHFLGIGFRGVDQESETV